MVAQGLTGLLIPVIHLATLMITGMSALYVGRQKTTEYLQVRNLLVLVHIFFMGVVGLELLRDITSLELLGNFMSVYTITGTNFVLADVFLLTLVALAIFYKPSGKGLKEIFRAIFSHRIQATFFILYSMYILISGAYLFVSNFGQQQVPNIVGYIQGLNRTACQGSFGFGCQLATQYTPFYLEMLLGILLIFMIYPSGLLLIARSRSSDEQVKSAFTVLPIAWVAIGLDLLFFNGYLLNEGIDASAIGYLVAAAAFAATASTFRRATLLSAFFQATSPVSTPAVAPASTFSGQLGLDTGKAFGRGYLLEVDPSVKYEESVRALALEFGTTQHLLYAFTSRGSPVYNSISKLENVRFFTLTAKVSYPKPGEIPNEVLVPARDQSQLLNILDKAITTNPVLKFGIVFDSITDLILSDGLETTYKFLKQAIEMTSSHAITAVFLMTSGAHNEREQSIVRSLFSNQLSYKSGHLAVDKMG
jgi:multisubunit Na+/H+ antiporter MnhG subunit